jgi:hypothetical protein
MTTLFVLGAGSSQGTCSFDPTGVPSCAAFGRVLARHFGTGGDDALLDVAEHLGFARDDWPLDKVWTWIDYHSKLCDALPDPKRSDLIGRAAPQLFRALLEVYGPRCDALADRLPLDATYTLGALLGSDLRAGDVLASFNYDVIGERLAKRFGRSISCTRGASDVVLLAKPHGSVSWKTYISTRTVRSCEDDGSPFLDSLAPTVLGTGLDSLLLGAVPIKSELVREVQAFSSWISRFDTITAEWRKVVTGIRDCKRIVIVGYSFPPEDQYGRFLVREGLRLRSLKEPSIEFYELPDKAAERAKEIVDAFSGHVRDIVYCGAVLPPTAA